MENIQPGQIKKCVKRATLLTAIMLFFVPLNGNADMLKRDDFQDHKSWWSWEQVGGGLPPQVTDGLVLLAMSYGQSFGPSDSAVWDGENIYGDVTVTLRAKALTPMKPGTIGWGLWNYVPPWHSFDISTSEIAWFMKQYDPVVPSNSWWGAWTRNGTTWDVNFCDLSATDPNEWHLYRMDRSGSAVDFFIDGVLIDHFENALPEGLLAFHAWIDNYNYPPDPTEPFSYRDFTGYTAFALDFVEIHDGHPGASEPPAGAVLLRDTPLEMGSGERHFQWKTYDFDSPGGTMVIIVTGRVESYDQFDDDDDIRLVIDGQDLGWDTITSLDGDNRLGANGSLVHTDSFPAGPHTLTLYGDVTPLLYDVTVIGSPNGEIILDMELDETAPGGSDYLWKEYPFSCAADGEVVLFISATARENIIDDDELRFVLDSEDFGWDTPESFRGDRLFGEAGTLVIRRTLTAGDHLLQIYADALPTLHRVMIYGSEESGPTNNPPVLDPIGNRQVHVNETLSFTVTASDPDEHELTFSADNLPPGAQIDPFSGIFDWTPVPGEAGFYPDVVFIATDDGDPPLSSSESITITVIGDTMLAELIGTPASGTLPLSVSILPSITNLIADQIRRASGRIDLTIAAGRTYSNWRSGWVDVAGSETFSTSFTANLPAVGSVVGQNRFTLVVEDVTSPPFNQPPWSPSGDSDSAECIVTGLVP